MNRLYYGDNLAVLREYIKEESVDLIYLDPPFNSQADYNVIFKDQSGQKASSQILAFEDSWHWGRESEEALDRMIQRHGKLAELLDLIVRTLNKNDLSAYLVMMAERLLELHRVLKNSGSIYLHCDPTASHYLKLILDLVFGPQHYRNEIIWKRSTGKSLHSRRLPTNHDVILTYGKTNSVTWNGEEMFLPYDQDQLPDKTQQKYNHRDPDGRLYTLDNLLNPNKDRPNLDYEFLGFRRVWRWTKERMQAAYEAGLVVQPSPGAVPRLKRYLDRQRGIALDDVWTDIPPLNSQAVERLGYPTQKPLALLERIVKASSNPGDVVLDPFCGCGTAVAAAQSLGRRWIGIDVTALAVGLIEKRLKRDYALNKRVDFEVIGTPASVQDALVMAENEPYQFQFWAVGELGAQAFGAIGDGRKGKKGGDTGIDGLMYFRTPDGGGVEKVVVSVKAGHNLNPGMVRDLRGTVEREKAAVGVFLCAHEPTRGMRDEAAKAGVYRWGSRAYPKIQILTVSEMMAGKQTELPRGVVNVSYEQREVKTLKNSRRAEAMNPLFAGE